MLRDPSGGRIPMHDRLEQMSNDGVPDDQCCAGIQRENQLTIALTSLVGAQWI